jgi:signal transduction histidine kinase
MLAHDLRNPLMMIRGEVALLRHAEGTSRVITRACAAIDRQVSHIAALVTDLARIADPGALDMSGPRQRMDLRLLIAESVDSVSKLTEMRSVQLSFVADWNPLIVEGNRVRLAQVFTTFLTSAAKATEPGSTIRVSAVSDEKSWVDVRVWDTGPGISSDSLPKLFDRLLADNGESTNGLGVALVVARQIVEAHGGKLTARTEGLEFGCEFTARLPRVESGGSEF